MSHLFFFQMKALENISDNLINMVYFLRFLVSFNSNILFFSKTLDKKQKEGHKIVAMPEEEDKESETFIFSSDKTTCVSSRKFNNYMPLIF